MRPWLGSYHTGAPGTMDSTSWAWLSGEPFTDYINWRLGEPNHPEETSIHILGAINGLPGTWNNYGPASASLVNGYLVEWNTNPVPLPPRLLLFGSGLLGLAGWRRFRKS